MCDEITSALDPELKNEVLDVLESFKRKGLTLILVTHEIGFAKRAADRVVMLADGKIIEGGPPKQVIDNPQAPRTQQFLKQILGYLGTARRNHGSSIPPQRFANEGIAAPLLASPLRRTRAISRGASTLLSERTWG